MENKTMRQSNIELLRIIAMLMIISHHFVLFNTNAEITIFQMVLLNWGKIGAEIFILISGYFLINKKFEAKKLLEIWLQVLFYSLSILILCMIFGNRGKIDTIGILKSIFPILFNNYWFVTIYVFLYILSPFINKFLTEISKESYRKLLIILPILFTVTNIITYARADKYIIAQLSIMLYVYALGGYIKLYKIEMYEKMNSIKCFLVFIVLYLIVLLIQFMPQGKIIFITMLQEYISNIESIVAIGATVSLFYTFKKLSIKQNDIINFVAKVGFATYLITEYPYLIPIFWEKIFCITSTSIIQNLEMLLLAETFIYCLTIVIEIFRMKVLEKNIFKTKLLNKIILKINNLENIDDRKENL